MQKEAQAKKHSQGVCTNTERVRKAVPSTSNLRKEPLPTPQQQPGTTAVSPTSSRLPGQGDSHPDPRAKQQLFPSWAARRQRSAPPCPKSHSAELMAASWQKTLPLFSFPFYFFFPFPSQTMLHLQQHQRGLRTRPQKHRSLAPASQRVRDISQVTPAHHNTPALLPQGHCRFHLLAGNTPTRAGSKGSRRSRHQPPPSTGRNGDGLGHSTPNFLSQFLISALLSILTLILLQLCE